MAPLGGGEMNPAEQGQALVARELMRHRTQLHAYLLAAVRNPHDAEDLLQEVSLAASGSWAQWRPDGPFLPWAREIARRRILDFAKKRDRRHALLDPAVLAALEAAAATLDAERPEPRREALRKCMDGLDGPDRADVPRIAGELGRTVQATYAILKRTKLILRDCVERRLASEAP
jgi:RNA polymerase sigma factor (sigma-70 family)